MTGHGLQARGIARRNKMLKAATFLFLEQGYDKTTTTQIAKAAGMSQASFFAAFESKAAILLELTKIMFSGQFVAAAASITRGFMARPCDLYFTMERKLRRYGRIQ